MLNQPLPILSYTASLFPDVSLEDTLVVACQHILGSTISLFEQLFSRRLSPQHVYLLGKCYSTNQEAAAYLAKQGVHVLAESTAYDSYTPYDDTFAAAVQALIHRVEREQDLRRFHKVIVLDDGGALLVAANQRWSACGNVVCVEQTSSGYSRLQQQSLALPVINVARSWAKLTYESPVIAEAVVQRLHRAIPDLLRSRPSTLVVGDGPIGQQVARLLAVFGPVTTYNRQRYSETFPGKYIHMLKNHQLIVGATGQPLIAGMQRDLLAGSVVLASVSSSDREFSAAEFRRLAPQTGSCHEHVEVDGVRLLNSGFPVNFDGALHSVAPEKIQLTRALLLAAIFQAYTATCRVGLNELDRMVQERIVLSYKYE